LTKQNTSGYTLIVRENNKPTLTCLKVLKNWD